MIEHPVSTYIKNNKLTKEYFAEHAGISRMTLFRVLKYEGKVTTGTIEKICIATNHDIEPNDFFKDLAIKSQPKESL